MAIGTATAIIGGSLIGGAASVIGGNAAAKGAKGAAAEQARQFDLVRQDTLPQRQLGQDAIGRIRQIYGYGNGPVTIDNGTGQAVPSGGVVGRTIAGAFGSQPATSSGNTVSTQYGSPDMSGFFASPDYQFNLAEGQTAIDRSAAARSGLLSGRAVKEGQRYASGLASREFSGFMDRLFQQAGIGSTGIGQSAASGANAANQTGAALQNAGNARASAYGGINNAVQGGVSNMLLQQYLKPSGGTPGYQAVNYQPTTGSYA